MTNSKLIKTGIVSVGIIAGGLGLQNDAKAAVNNVRNKVKNVKNNTNYSANKQVTYNANNTNTTKKQNVNGVTYNNVKPKVKKVKVNRYKPAAVAGGAAVNYSISSKKNSTTTNSGKSDIYSTAKKATKISKKNIKKYKAQIKNASVMTKLKPKKKKSASFKSRALHNTDSDMTVSSADKSMMTVSDQSSQSSQNSSSANSSSSAADNSSSSVVVSDNTSSSTMKKIINEGKKYLGAAYEYGATGENGTFDCSGFTKYIYQHYHISLPRTAQQQYDSFEHVDASDAKKGDLVFFGSSENNISHVGIYMGNGKMIDAQDRGVITENVNAPWWNLIGYARVSE